MVRVPPPPPARQGVMQRLAGDTAGNALALMAAALLPLLAMVGGAVDMSRAYLANARLQQACDAGVLGARKYLGTEVVVTNQVPAGAATVGNRLFNLNYRAGQYNSRDRAFQMALEGDYTVTGEASVTVPTAVMRIFGMEDVDVEVTCEADMSVPNLDIMMALDVTGSMRHTIPGDSVTRIDALKNTIRNFHTQIEGSKSPGTITRYGFVPYNANVNVGALLEDDWVVDDWTYQSREAAEALPGTATNTYWRNTVIVSGTRTAWVTESTYPATVTTSGEEDEDEEDEEDESITTYSCTGSQPADTITETNTPTGASYVENQTDPAAVLTIQPEREVEDGVEYRTVLVNGQCEVQVQTSNNYTRDYEKVTALETTSISNWRYAPITSSVSNWRTETDGCIEERATYQILDYTNVDLTLALDLDLDLVPNAADTDTQWRPSFPDRIYGRAFNTNGSGTWSVPELLSTSTYSQFGNQWMSDCPPPAQKMQPMTGGELDTYLATLSPEGSTYHDIGMIWAGRLISPTGLFATENADTNTITRSRHVIWMTDGQTEPYDVSYNSYGLEPLDRRRWDPATSTYTLTEVVENRFLVACDQVKKMNVTVWVIAFGTGTTSIMEECAGEGRYFEAANADELNFVFTKIADAFGDLRMTD